VDSKTIPLSYADFFHDILIHSKADMSKPIQSNEESGTQNAITRDILASLDASSQLCHETNQLPDESYSLPPLPPFPTEAQIIQEKRLRSAIAARKARKRISERRRKLQESVVWLQEQRDGLKAQVLALEALLKRHGLEGPEYEFMGEQIHADSDPFEHKDQLAGESYNLPPNATEAQVKRLQKRIAARKLDSEIELLQEQMDHWKMQVLIFEALLKQYGIECPESYS
jgi:hypothetical protein